MYGVIMFKTGDEVLITRGYYKGRPAVVSWKVANGIYQVRLMNGYEVTVTTCEIQIRGEE
jgi:hypothetical protein